MLICTLISVSRLASALEREALGLGNGTGKGGCRWGLMGRGYRRLQTRWEGAGTRPACGGDTGGIFLQRHSCQDRNRTLASGNHGHRNLCLSVSCGGREAARKKNKCITGRNTWATLWDTGLGSVHCSTPQSWAPWGTRLRCIF